MLYPPELRAHAGNFFDFKTLSPFGKLPRLPNRDQSFVFLLILFNAPASSEAAFGNTS
jgi:hypothetical protein